MSTQTLTMAQALNQALDHALATDPDVYLLGEDIVDPVGGAVQVTLGLSTKHGRDRVRETPISEQAILGCAIGSAMVGAKPVAEIMIADFYAVCLDQLVNHAAKLRYVSGGRTTAPIVVRGPVIAGLNFGAQHSLSPEAWLVHTPGLKVAMPSNPADAKGILLTAIDDPDPVVILEPVRLYSVAGPCPTGDHRVPVGSASVVRDGRDVTVISYGHQVPVALEAAERLRDEISVEVIDLRWLAPWDEELVVASVRKTTRAVVTHQAVKCGGFGAEIASVLQQRLWGALAAPVGRVAALNTPVPFATGLELDHLPGVDDLIAGIRATVSGG